MDPVPFFEGECVKRRDYKNGKKQKCYSKKAIESQRLLNVIDGRVAAEAATKHGISAQYITINYYGNQTEVGSYALVYAKGRRCKVVLTLEMVAKATIEVIVKSKKKKNKGVLQGKPRGTYKK